MSRFVCPKCGEDEINELTVCVVSHPVKTGATPESRRVLGNPIVDWQSDYPYSIVGGRFENHLRVLQLHGAIRAAEAKRGRRGNSDVTKSRNSHWGSTLNDFLKEEGIYEQATTGAIKSAIAMQFSRKMRKKRITKT